VKRRRRDQRARTKTKTGAPYADRVFQRREHVPASTEEVSCAERRRRDTRGSTEEMKWMRRRRRDWSTSAWQRGRP
jgi:hypothetical protein